MHSTSITLLQRVRTVTDNEAWTRFVQLYAPLLTGWATRAGLTESDAVDVVQDVFVKLMKLLPEFQYDNSRKNFRGLLKTIITNEVRDRQRKKKPVAMDDAIRELPVEDANNDDSWDEEYRQHVISQALKIMQKDFESNTWRACWETTVNSRSAKEVAAQLGMSEAAVYVAKGRVLRRLREELVGLWE